MAEKVADLAALKTAQDGDYIERVVRGRLQRLTRTGLDDDGNLVTASEAISPPVIAEGTLPPELMQLAAETLIYLFSDPTTNDLTKKSRPYVKLNGDLYPLVMPVDFQGAIDVAELIVSSDAPTITPGEEPTWGMWVRNQGQFEVYFWFATGAVGSETYNLLRLPISYTLSEDGALQSHDSLDLSQV